MPNPVPPKFALVYQGHIANVFKVDNFHQSSAMRGEVTRIRQGIPGECQFFAEGAVAAGAEVRTYHVTNLGDASKQTWGLGIGELTSDQNRVPVFSS